MANHLIDALRPARLDPACPDVAMDEHAVLEALEGQLARYKSPKRVIFLDGLPRNAMGKVQKNLLRAQYQGLYGG